MFFFLTKHLLTASVSLTYISQKKCIPKSRKVIWKEEDNIMFKLWQRGKEIRSDCSNKKRTHHQTELTFKMRLLLIATSLALATVSDSLETHFPLQISFLNPNTIQGGPTQRGPSKVASSSREGCLQIQTKIARGINLVFWQQLLKVAGPTAPDIMTQIISQGGFWNSISAPGSTKTIWVQVMRFSNFTKPDLVLCLYMSVHILQEGKQELCRGVRPRKSKWNWRPVSNKRLHCINDGRATFKTFFHVGSSFNLHEYFHPIHCRFWSNWILHYFPRLICPSPVTNVISSVDFLFSSPSPLLTKCFPLFHVCISFSFADQMCPFSK